LIDNPPIYIDSGTSTTPDLDMIERQETERLGFALRQGGDQEIRDKEKNFAPETTTENSIEDDPRHYTRVRLRQLIPSNRRSVGIQCDYVPYVLPYISSVGIQSDDLPYDSPYISEDEDSEVKYEEG
jgi:hypothetical protein